MLRRLKLEFIPASDDLALLVLRLVLGLNMLIAHGLPKLSKLAAGETAGFPDPVGVGAAASLTLAVLTEVGAGALLALGLFGRGAALALAGTMVVAFFLVHGAKLTGANNGELAFIYLAGYVAIFIAGTGRFSLDRFIGSKSEK